MTRYTMVTDRSSTVGFAAQQDDAGEWVRYSDLAAARAEIERLTKERDEARILASDRLTVISIAAKERDEARAERDEARAQVAGTFEAWGDPDAIAWLKTHYPDVQAALQSMLADAERDMRQRAADACAGIEVDRWDKWKDGSDMLDQGASDGAGECVNAILALPLKHADREGWK